MSLVDLEDRSSRNNLRIDGIAVEPNESWEHSEGQIAYLNYRSIVVKVKRNQVK